MVACLALLPAGAFAAAGTSDPSFGSGGRVADNFGPAFNESNFMTVEAAPGDGVVVWQRGPSLNQGFRSYAPGGSLQADTDNPEWPPWKLVQADGKTVEIALSFTNEKTTIRRRLTNGQLDPSFGEGGQEELPALSGFGNSVANFLQLPSGKFLIAGSHLVHQTIGARTTESEYDGAVVRLDEDGTPDPTFGSGGIVETKGTLGIPTFSRPGFMGVAVRNDEALAVAVKSESSREQKDLLVGVTAAGGLDKGFGSEGTVAAPGTFEIHAAPEGKILVAGTGESTGEPFVTRLTDTGQPDPSYGEAGTSHLDFSGIYTIGSVLWEADGAAVLGGGSDADGPLCRPLGQCEETPVLTRIDPSGHLDAGFGEGGEVRLTALTEPAQSIDERGIEALAVRPGGGVYASGESGTTAFVAAVDAAGAPVAGFGEAGVVTSRYPQPSTTSVTDVATDGEGRILTVGQTDSGAAREAGAGYVRRLLRNGAPDPSFGGAQGFVRMPRDAQAVAVDGRERPLVLGGEWVLRLTPSGTVDGSFAEGGLLFPKAPKGYLNLALTAIDPLPSGKLLVAGTVGVEHTRIIVFRFKADGSPDRSFGRGGWQVVPRQNAEESAAPTVLATAPDSRILIGGYVTHEGGGPWFESMEVARLLPDGRFDPGFGRRGVVFPKGGAGSRVTSIAFQVGGVLVAGLTRGKGRSVPLVFRYRDDGTLSRGFGKRGVIRGKPGNRLVTVASRATLLVSHHRLILVRGGSDEPVTAYRPDGTPIPSSKQGERLIPKEANYWPFATLQGSRPILAWTVGGEPRHGSVTWVQRLTAR